ncbi:MAG: multiprotein bridging factor aMBF1 [Candidatus Thermoplasmatota archaeon]
MECELCGKKGQCKPAILDGVKMMLCPNCQKIHGVKTLSGDLKSTTSTDNISVKERLKRIKKIRERDVYQEHDMNKTLINNWNEKIKKARQKQNLSREDLGNKVNIKTSAVKKIENKALRPSDKVAEKIEKILKINLFMNLEETQTKTQKTDVKSRGLTIGDLIDKKQNK